VNQKSWFTDKYYIFVARTIFGISVESIDLLTMEDAFNAITERFPQITANDIHLSFKTFQSEEKVYILTRDIFLKPIQEFMRKKNIVLQEIAREVEKETERKETERKEIEFRQQAKTVYIESLKQGKWLGTIFQAAAIGRNFSNVISDEDREKWNRLAKEMEKKNNLENKNNPIKDFVPIPWQKFYAQFAMQDLISRRQKFIEI